MRRRILRWYAASGRDLPWRRTADPYAVLVSEVMLQQTQVTRVVPAYERFLQRFPTLAALASAPLGDVLREWAGLGYNRRARDLHLAARAHPAALPRTRPELQALPGVGRYTAGAVACFAYGDAEPLADTNIARVLGRALLGRPSGSREGERLDALVMPVRGTGKWHHAVMDLGATVCLSRHPRCDACPIRGLCVAHRAGTADIPAPRRLQEAFATSDRRVRGRIVAALRAAPDGLQMPALRRAVGDARTARCLGALVGEGLVVREGGRARLP